MSGARPQFRYKECMYWRMAKGPELKNKVQDINPSCKTIQCDTQPISMCLCPSLSVHIADWLAVPHRTRLGTTFLHPTHAAYLIPPPSAFFFAAAHACHLTAGWKGTKTLLAKIERPGSPTLPDDPYPETTFASTNSTSIRLRESTYHNRKHG